MTTYAPDDWAIIKVKSKDPHYRVLGGWRGGYLDGDSWRLNSGVTKCTAEGDYYLFEGTSGSVYKCHREAYGLSAYLYSAFVNWDNGRNVLEVVEDQENWEDFDWSVT